MSHDLETLRLCSIMLIIGAIALLGCWLQWRGWIIGMINRWRAKRYIKREAARSRFKRLGLHR